MPGKEKQMDAREYLSQIRRADIIIQQDRLRIEELKTKAASVGSFDYSRDRVQSSGTWSVADDIAEYIEMEKRIEQQTLALERTKTEVIERIRQMENTTHMDLLIRYYVHHTTRAGHRKTLEDVAAEMRYSPFSIRRMHGQALREMQALIEKK